MIKKLTILIFLYFSFLITLFTNYTESFRRNIILLSKHLTNITNHYFSPEPQLERCSRGSKISFQGGQNFWACLLFSEFSVDFQKKRSSRQFGLLFFEFSVDLKKKRLSRQFGLLSSEFSVGFQKKATILKLLQWKGEFGWACWAVWEGKIFVWGAPPPFAPAPPSCGSAFHTK